MNNLLGPFSWSTLPVFFHSGNSSGIWNQEALSEIGRYSMVTFEKAHANMNRKGRQEHILPGECARVKKAATNSTTVAMYYLNSVFDWPFYELHDLMLENPKWRLKDTDGKDITITGKPDGAWCFNLSIPELREYWISDCLQAVADGCDGCYIDRSNNMTQVSVQSMSKEDSIRFELAHMETLSELNRRLADIGSFAISNNQGIPAEETVMMMFEDFAASEHCIRSLQLAAERNLGVQAHAGDIVDDGTNATENGCGHGDINAMAAFLIGAGEYAYYHCAKGWQSDEPWPLYPDAWLDWRDEYDRPLGKPLANGTKGSRDGIWRRFFSFGTYIEFDSKMGNGTIWWADGTIARGKPPIDRSQTGCTWQTMTNNGGRVDDLDYRHMYAADNSIVATM